MSFYDSTNWLFIFLCLFFWANLILFMSNKNKMIAFWYLIEIWVINKIINWKIWTQNLTCFHRFFNALSMINWSTNIQIASYTCNSEMLKSKKKFQQSNLISQDVLESWSWTPVKQTHKKWEFCGCINWEKLLLHVSVAPGRRVCWKEGNPPPFPSYHTERSPCQKYQRAPGQK